MTRCLPKHGSFFNLRTDFKGKAIAMNKSILILAGVTLLASAAIIGQTIAQTAPAAEATPRTTDAAAARGAQAWANHCSRCHNLRSPSELNAELWDVSVQHMRVRANLPGSVADDIKLFLMSSAASGARASMPGETDGSAVPSFAHLALGDPLRGKEVYSQTCFACHGADGKGAIDGVPDLTIADRRLAKPDEIVLMNIIKGYQSEGSIMAMPPMGGNPDLTEQDMADVLAYMRKEFEKEE